MSDKRFSWRSGWRGAAGAAILAGALLPAGVLAQGEKAAAPVPDLSGFYAHNTSLYLPPSEGGIGPLMDHPDHPHALVDGRLGTPWVGDWTNPNLKPWAAEIVKANAELELSGGSYLVAYQLCYPLGVPLILTQRENIQLLQEPDLVTIVYQRDHQVRRVYLNVPHSENPQPSWYGESVGHYEGGTLVVDTIALDTRAVVDRYGTPHTEALHVVERYRKTEDGGLQVDFTVEDPGAFNAPWSATQKYRASEGPFREIVCAENNRHADGSWYDIPVAAEADF